MIVRENRVEDAMSTALIAMHESDSIATVRREMRRAHIHHVPIIDAAQHVVGVISVRDLPSAAPPGLRAGDVMTRAVVTVRPGDPIEDARALMSDNGFHSLPVVGDDEQLVGIVTMHDVRRACVA